MLKLESQVWHELPAPEWLRNQMAAEVAPLGILIVRSLLDALLVGTPVGAASWRTLPVTSCPPGLNLTLATTSQAGWPLCVPRHLVSRSRL